MNTANYQIINAKGTQEGADAFVHRLFPVPVGHKNWDPFVLWDHFTLQGGTGFPSHPHRGFEGITYVLDGSMQHADSLGNRSTVHAGGIQRFTAGKGIEHSEKPAAVGETNGIQLWVNLAQADKQLPPGYQAVNPADVPESRGDGWHARQVLGKNSPVALQTPAELLDLNMNAEAEYLHNIEQGQQGLVYLLQGNIRIDGQGLYAQQALLFKSVLTLNISASSDARLIIANGLPHNEPIFQHGPFVD